MNFISINPYFSYFISLNIILNTIVLAMDRYPQLTAEDNLLEILNIVFYTIFLAEMLIKITGLGFKKYIKNYFNSFDCTIVIISSIDVIIQSILKANNNGSNNSAITALRAFRLLRVFKLAQSWKKFQELLKTIFNTLKDVSTFSILLFLFIFTYTLLGLEIYSYSCAKTKDDLIDLINGTPPQSNFDGFYNAFLTVFILLTGDGWSQIMLDYYRA